MSQLRCKVHVQYFLSVPYNLNRLITWHTCVLYRDDVQREAFSYASSRSMSHLEIKNHILHFSQPLGRFWNKSTKIFTSIQGQGHIEVKKYMHNISNFKNKLACMFSISRRCPSTTFTNVGSSNIAAGVVQSARPSGPWSFSRKSLPVDNKFVCRQQVILINWNCMGLRLF